MPYFLNADTIKNSFTEVAKYKYFVDKTKMIKDINECIETPDKYLCITRPRRFGKTINAMMLACYYSRTADFKQLFDNTEINKCEFYEKHLNQHNIVYINFSANASSSETYKEYINYYKIRLIRDIVEVYPNIVLNDPIDLILQKIFETTKQGFIFILRINIIEN
ncbi:hypothetical protein FACS189465_0970 [Clostridia bacterium]|nr:hypothetical protein FACS189465_0970 [Clostridia bacterium]